MVAVFREVRRVLRDDGTLWLNLGDSYAANWNSCRAEGGGGFKDNDRTRNKYPPEGLKPKDLIGIPWRVAFALQADGWYLRSDIIWAKPNPMPESVTDRPTRSHEYLFLLSKQPRYYYDADAIREPQSEGTFERYKDGEKIPSFRKAGGSDRKNAQFAAATPLAILPNGRNKRDVWTINSEPTPEAHFATFPQKLVEPCILAGTSEKGECSQCGKNWVRVTDVSYDIQSPISETDKARNPAQGNNFATRALGRATKNVQTTGWRPQCACNAPTRPNIVFDPFLGSGTVGRVAERLGRRWVGTELSGEYIEICRRRTRQMGLRFAEA